MGILCLAVLVLLLAPHPPAAATLEEAKRLFVEGDFLAAAEAGSALDTAEGCALAAHAIVVHGYYLAGPASREAFYVQAIELAERAIKLDPENGHAHVSSAIAMGRYSQEIGVPQAMNEGFAERIKAALDQALELDPDNPLAHAALGGWHSELVQAASPAYASMWYGAKRHLAIKSFERAISLAPELNAMYKEYAAGLLRLDRAGYNERAREILRRAVEIPLTDALSALVREEAARMLRNLTAEATQPEIRPAFDVR